MAKKKNTAVGESLPMAGTSAPVVKILVECEKGHQKMMEPDANMVCGECNFTSKMKPKEPK